MEILDRKLYSDDDQFLGNLRSLFHVYTTTGNLREVWNNGIDISPSVFYNVLTDNLPDTNSISLDLNSCDEGVLTIKSKALEAEIFFSALHKKLKIEEVVVGNDYKRHGVGKTLLRNCINFSNLLGIKTIELRAGRDDGEFFWSKRGGVLEDVDIIKSRFISKVRKNLSELEHMVGRETPKKVNRILNTDDIRMSFAIASMKETLNSQPIGTTLLKTTNPMLYFHLDDKKQMHQVALNLK